MIIDILLFLSIAYYIIFFVAFMCGLFSTKKTVSLSLIPFGMVIIFIMEMWDRLD